MKDAITPILVSVFLFGCAGTPPKPAKCIGAFNPVNVQGQAGLLADPLVVAQLCKGGGHGNQG